MPARYLWILFLQEQWQTGDYRNPRRERVPCRCLHFGTLEIKSPYINFFSPSTWTINSLAKLIYFLDIFIPYNKFEYKD